MVTPGSRSSDGYYQGPLEADVFEAWADVAHRYGLDPDRTSIVGYSMGGYGAYRLGGLYPDLFARAVTVVEPPSQGIWFPPAQPPATATLSNVWLESNRNLPYLNMAARQDPLVPYAGPNQQNTGSTNSQGHTSFDAHGYRIDGTRARLDGRKLLVDATSTHAATLRIIGGGTSERMVSIEPGTHRYETEAAPACRDRGRSGRATPCRGGGAPGPHTAGVLATR